MSLCLFSICFFFFNVPATTEIYTLSLHDALPIFAGRVGALAERRGVFVAVVSRNHTDRAQLRAGAGVLDRKSTRLNSSHLGISYAVFCLKKKNKQSQWRDYKRFDKF